MGYIFAIIININNFIGALNKKNTRLLFFTTFILMWLIFGWNYQNPDYNNYFRMYSNIQYSSGLIFEGKELGYKLLMNIAVNLGLSYQAFVIVISFLGLVLISNTVKRYSPNRMYVFLLYFIYPYFLDIVQIRNFLMMSIIIFSVRYLVDDTRNSKLKYLLLNLIAISIHSAAVLYTPFILIKFKNKNIIRFGIFSVLCFSVIIFLNNNEIPFIEQIVRIFTDDKYILRWFTMSTRFGFLLYWLLHFATFLLFLYSKIIIAKYKEYLDNNEVRFFRVVYWINVIGFYFFIFYMVNTEFVRLMRNLSLLNYISFAIVNKSIGNRNLKLKSEYNFLVIIFTLILFIIQLLVPHLETVIKPVLENNLFW